MATPERAPTTTFGVFVKQRRLARGWSQGQLAEESGLSGGYISLIETGRRGLSPSPRTLVALVTALGCDPVELFQAAGRTMSAADAADLRVAFDEEPEVIRAIRRDSLLKQAEQDDLIRRYGRYTDKRRPDGPAVNG